MAITEKSCSVPSSCCSSCGWLGKKVLGLSLCVWILLFAVLPFSARGVSWTAKTAMGWVVGAKEHRGQACCRNHVGKSQSDAPKGQPKK